MIIGSFLTGAVVFRLRGLDSLVGASVPLFFAVQHIACDRLEPGPNPQVAGNTLAQACANCGSIVRQLEGSVLQLGRWPAEQWLGYLRCELRWAVFIAK